MHISTQRSEERHADSKSRSGKKSAQVAVVPGVNRADGGGRTRRERVPGGRKSSLLI